MESHWYTGVVNARKREIQVLDSIGYELGVKDLEKVVSYCITTSSYFVLYLLSLTVTVNCI
jgi:Ulp1 family protease